MDNVSEQGANHEAQPQALELFHVGAAAETFYGATQSQLSGGPDGWRLVLNATSEPILAGQGEDKQSALADALERMRDQETIKTRRNLVEVAMTNTASVRLTSLEDYQPRIAPGSPAYALPEYAQDALRVRPHSMPETYQHTTEQEGWQAATRSVVSAYLSRTIEGQALADALHIRSLDHLSPEQVVKLSTTLVRNLSRYSLDDADRADHSTTAELLSEGMRRRGDSGWIGNGVCRNIAANIQAVFEALKETQSEPSMLNNTYCVCETGVGGTGYADRRQDPGVISMKLETGHAWNTFVTVDGDGSAAITKVDATWALGTPVDTVFHDLDQTDRRSVTLVAKLFRQSELKAETFANTSHYFASLIDKSRRSANRNTKTEADFQEFVATEWLRLARSDRNSALAPLYTGTLSTFMDLAVRLSGKLDPSEIDTLYAIDNANGSLERERLKHVIKQFDVRPAIHMGGEHEGNRLIFADSTLQGLVYDAVGAKRVAELAERSGTFRARLRELEPHQLPAFDPDHSPADLQELMALASSNGIHDRSPAAVMAAFDRKLRAACPDPQRYQTIVDHNRGYKLASNFKKIMRGLQGSSAR